MKIYPTIEESTFTIYSCGLNICLILLLPLAIIILICCCVLLFKNLCGYKQNSQEIQISVVREMNSFNQN